MKYLVILLTALTFTVPTFASDEEGPGKGQIKEVCREVEKNGKTVKECKKIKVRKKLEGTEIPNKSK